MINYTVIAPARSLSGKTAFVNGTVTERRMPDNDTVRLTVDGYADGVPIRFALYAPDCGAQAGDTVIFTAKFSDLKDTADFSEVSYNFGDGIFVKAHAVGEITVEKGFSFIALLRSVSDFLKERVMSAVGGDEGAILCALFFGDRSGLSAEISAAVKRSGISHMTAVSGMHLSLIIHAVDIFIKRLPKRTVRLRFVIIASFILLMMLFFGMTVSVMRSCVMQLIFYAAKPLRRQPNAVCSVSAALFIIVLFQPYACRDIGLWLSALATIGVGTVSPSVMKRIHFPEWFAAAGELVVASVCAVVCTVPIIAFSFGGISLLSVISTLAVYLLFYIALMLMFISAATGGLFAETLMLPAGALAKGINYIITAFGGLKYSYISFEGQFMPYFGLLTVICIIICFVLTERLRYPLCFAVISLCAAATFSLAQRLSSVDTIKINIYSDGNVGLAEITSSSGVSVLSWSDSERLTDRIISCTLGRDTKLICIANRDENSNYNEINCRCTALHTPETQDGIYNINGEYTVTVKDGGVLLEINGVSVALAEADAQTAADFTIYCGYSKDAAEKNGIFCDKRYSDEGIINAYYESIGLRINKAGEVFFLREGGRA